MAYAYEAHLAAEAGGTTWDGWAVAVNERALTRTLSEVTATLLDARKDSDPWTFADGVDRPLTNDRLKVLSLQIRRHIGVCLAVYNQVAAGIGAGAITTAEVDGAFADVDAIVLKAAS
ncbi:MULTISPECIES: hypothetical protein [unclassified Methylobacterium]|uniref:DUF4376 domain-containing protein n=1 Tax=unclassified Methylobacterium TaxID=2615210 RepID=UPI0006FCC998|nr:MULTISPECIES: hypothetical protein [unclassified Methylobacterium]KQP13502.1 hypothetical protein ASF26_19225 [Methylobacterium sp. Leaf93]TXN41145.1 DUF4376 domain-containing protein [Methylobacterium sp. WL93]TXN51452.1 DUF4376 domain-containing protein [Methylobacterium sp. WL119]TXN67680.1 DUF4376 domain-containing protein [Methylobacterium sp. WL30]